MLDLNLSRRNFGAPLHLCFACESGMLPIVDIIILNERNGEQSPPDYWKVQPIPPSTSSLSICFKKGTSCNF
jgi:hypothetical protein